MTSRGKNFTEREKCQLLELVQKYKNIIENKCTNAVSTNNKSEAWAQLTLEFNSNAEVPRTQKQLNTAYLNLKRSTRQNIANENVKNYLSQRDTSADAEQIVILSVDELNAKKEASEIKSILKQFKKDEVADKRAVMATGGGLYKPKLSCVGAQMLAIIGDQVKPLSNNCDSASSYYVNDESETINSQITEVAQCSQSENNNMSIPSKIKRKDRKNILQKKRRPSNTEHLKIQYYKKKIECAIIEKKSKLIECEMQMKKKKDSGFRIKNKTERI